MAYRKSSQVILSGIVAGLLLLSTSILIYESSRVQDPRSRAQTPIVSCDVNDGSVAIDGGEQRMLDLVNAHRQKYGIAPLKFSPHLARSAAWMSDDMSNRGVVSHTDSLGRGPASRMRDCGGSGGATGENIASFSEAEPDTAFSFWRSSGIHNRAMLNSNYKVIGIARNGRYWTQNFGSVDDSGIVIKQTVNVTIPTKAPTPAVTTTENTPITDVVNPTTIELAPIASLSPILPPEDTEVGSGPVIDFINKIVDLLTGK